MPGPAIHSARLEPDILRIGRTIFERAERAAPSVFSQEYWQTFGMNAIADDDSLKLRLFRFVEVLPILQSNRELADHLHAYLADRPLVGDNFYARAFAMLAQLAHAGSMTANLIGPLARFVAATGAKRFIAGATPAEAIRSVKALRQRGNTFTLDVLGETILADRVAREHQQLYIDLIESIATDAEAWPDVPLIDRAPFGLLPKVNLSIKLSAIVAKFDPIDPTGVSEMVLERVRPIFRAAQRTGAFVNVDMEHYAVKDFTLDIFKRVLTEPEFRDWPHVGIVIQAYMPESERDMADLITWSRQRGCPITVRLVKGAYWDSETANSIRNGWPIPLFTEKWQSDAHFERVGAMLLENADVMRPAFASHNVRSIAAMLAREQAMGLPARTLELQMLTGMGEPLRRALTSMKQRVRVYAPFGDMMTGMAYLIRRLIENTANESFLRQSYAASAESDALLRNPNDPQSQRPATLPKAQIADPPGEASMSPFHSEPTVDFSRPAEQSAMQQALDRVRAEFDNDHLPLLATADSTDGRPWRVSHHPADPSETVGRYLSCATDDVNAAVDAARTVTPAWAALPADARADLLENTADRIREQRYDLAAWLVFEIGKNWREAISEVTETIDIVRFHAHDMRRLTARNRRRDWPGEANEYVYAPRGIVGVIGPFCFPLSLVAGMASAALVTGNACIVKPARQASIASLQCFACFHEAGIPRAVLQVVTGDGPEVGAALAAHHKVDMVAFTGSTMTGTNIAQQARAQVNRRGQFKHVLASMGAKNAIIVDDDADLDDAVGAVLDSAFSYCGQKCTSCSRVIVLDGVYDAFVKKLTEAAKTISPGAPEKPGTGVGPVIDDVAVQRYRRWIDLSAKQGRLVLPGGVPDSSAGGYFVKPAIVADVAPDAEIAQTELMLPILCVHKANNFEDALRIANAGPYAMVGGVFSRMPANIDAAKMQLDVGLLYLNRKITLSRVDRQPFGGHGQSGIGAKLGGPDYLQEFCTSRVISENTLRHGFDAADAKQEEKVKA